jgi:hypothetical protein
MTLTEIFEELPKLSPEDRLRLREELDDKYLEDFEETPEMIAFVEEGLRSAREERTYTIEEVREKMRTWRLDSK